MSNPFVKMLEEKRKQWRKDHPYGFVARPIKLYNGSLNMFEWHCEFDGPPCSIWTEGTFHLTIKFPRDHRQRMSIYFVPPIFHPNVDSAGRVCSSITSLWPKVGFKQILLNMQSFLDNPNTLVPENPIAAHLFEADFNEYKRRVCENIAQHHRAASIMV